MFGSTERSVRAFNTVAKSTDDHTHDQLELTIVVCLPSLSTSRI